MTFSQWLDTFVSEKEIDLEETFEVMGPSGPNFMSYQTVVDAMKSTSDREKYQLKAKLITLDYRNANIGRYLQHIAQALAI
jgi:hypothetical protein